MADIGQKNQTLITGRISYGFDGTDAWPIKAGTTDASSSLATQFVAQMPVKTVRAELLPAQSIAASTQTASSILSLTGVNKATIFIDHGRAATAAFGANGTEYRVEVAQAATATGKWRTIASVLAGSAVCLAVASSADAAVAATTITVTSGTSIPSRGDIVFWANTVSAASSEWMKVKSVSGTASFVIEDGLDYAQDSDTNIFTQAEEFVLTVDVQAATRMRVMVNNNASSSTQAVYSRVACITEG